MKSVRLKLKIDRKHSALLIAGQAVAIKVPKGVEIIELRLDHTAKQMGDSFAKICDVVFNGRPA